METHVKHVGQRAAEGLLKVDWVQGKIHVSNCGSQLFSLGPKGFVIRARYCPKASLSLGTNFIGRRSY